MTNHGHDRCGTADAPPAAAGEPGFGDDVTPFPSRAEDAPACVSRCPGGGLDWARTIQPRAMNRFVKRSKSQHLQELHCPGGPPSTESPRSVVAA